MSDIHHDPTRARGSILDARAGEYDHRALAMQRQRYGAANSPACSGYKCRSSLEIEHCRHSILAKASTSAGVSTETV